ncbi:MAG TPA: PspC domain-containing protein [Candidatus Limnocylindrales bacterium]|nr:PspC domain-containing protein [Candidatus Limnocylindrales bacterium]
MSTRLYRSRRDRMLAGVAGGLAEMWGADPALVRIIWALLVVFTGGIALLIYIVMAIVIPDEEDVFGTTGAPRAARPPRPGGAGGMSPAVLVGGFLVILGGFFLIRELFPRIDFDWFWPLILVAIGVLLIVTAMGRGPRPGGPPPPEPPPWSPSEPTSLPPPPPTSAPPPPPPTAAPPAPPPPAPSVDDESTAQTQAIENPPSDQTS